MGDREEGGCAVVLPYNVKCVPAQKAGTFADVQLDGGYVRCSSDTRCRLHWSRLTGRDYYKGE